MPLFTDQLGRKVEITIPPGRIVSVVPSQTELLYDLGCGEQLAGQTVFCIHPRKKFKQAVKVGGTKKLNLAKIMLLNPDLVIANKEENTKEDIEELAKHFPVWISDIYNLGDALQMIEHIGEICRKQQRAEEVMQRIRQGFDRLKPQKRLSCLYLIWKSPWMAAGRDTFVNDMLVRCGFENMCAVNSRYPEFSSDELVALNPQVVLLSSEPFPFKKSHAEELRQLLPHAKILLVDGEMFSWYGSRLQYSAAYFEGIL